MTNTDFAMVDDLPGRLDEPTSERIMEWFAQDMRELVDAGVIICGYVRFDEHDREIERHIDARRP